MVTRLPKYIDAVSLADKSVALEGSLPVSDFDRLAELLFEQSGEVTVNLLFSRVGRLPEIHGKLSVLLKLKCQRCLESVEFPVDAELNLGIVHSLEQADRLPDNVDPLLLVNQDKILLKDIIEDELLLSLPTVPRHQHDCKIKKNEQQQDKPVNETKSAPENAFSKLAVLKKPEK